MFAVDPSPRIFLVSPHIGVASGGTRVTISGAFLGRNQDDLTTNGAAVGFGTIDLLSNLTRYF